MRFFNLNVKHLQNIDGDDGRRESHAVRWLDERRRAPIFFGNSRISAILDSPADSGLKGRALQEAQAFCQLGRTRDLWPETFIVTIDEGWVWLYRPCQEIEEEELAEYRPDITKSFCVEILGRTRIRDVPLILASMKSSPNFSRSTFQEIPVRRNVVYAANALAIASVLRSFGLSPVLPAALEGLQPLDCLSSLEFETLVAKLFEAHGCFVPAYKGGYMKDIDLIVHNDNRMDVRLGALLVPAGECRSIQIKLRLNGRPEHARGSADYLIARERDVIAPDCFGREWIVNQLDGLPTGHPLRAWLDRAARWSQ